MLISDRPPDIKEFGKVRLEAKKQGPEPFMSQ